MLRTSIYPLILGRVTVQGIGVGHKRALEDLARATDRQGIKPVVAAEYPFQRLPDALDHLERGAFGKVVVKEIGRASCRERVCQYVSISLVAGSIQKKRKHNTNTTLDKL